MTSFQRLARYALAAATLVCAGCQRPTHSESKADAMKHWNEVRAGVKLQLAKQQFEQGIFEDAITNASSAVALSPKLVDGYVLIAFSRIELGQSASAQSVIDEATRLGLVHSDLRYIQGVLFEQRGKLKQSVEAFAKARALDDTRVEYLFAYAESLASLGRLGESLEILADNLDRFDASSEVATLAARVAQLGGDTSLAIEYYRIALARGARDPSVGEAKGLLLAENSECGEAIGILTPLLQEDSVGAICEGAVRRALSGCLLESNEPRRASEVIEEYASLHPHDVTSTALAAMSVWRGGDSEAALAILSKNVSTTQDASVLRCLRGEILLSLNRPEEASDAFQEALRSDSEQSWASAALALIASE